MSDFGIPGLEDLQEIGRGGFGVVYRARQVALDRNVAVKMLAVSLTDEASISRFGREGRAMGVVSGHPNVVVLYEYGVTRLGQPYLVLEYLPRGSLADRVHDTGPMSIEEATASVIDLAGALETAHRAGVLHRDVKPENVMVDHFGEPKLGDFGIARLDGTFTGTQGTMASPAHAPPELIEGGRATAQSDVYSLASLLYQLLAGHAAFVRDTDESMIPLLARLVREPPPDLAPVGVPPGLQEVVFRALAKDPADRPATALEFGEQLNDARQGVGYPSMRIRVLDVSSPAAGSPSAPKTLQRPVVVPPVQTMSPPLAPPPATSPPPTVAPTIGLEAPSGSAPPAAPPPTYPPAVAPPAASQPGSYPATGGIAPPNTSQPQWAQTPVPTPPSATPPSKGANRAPWFLAAAILFVLLVLGAAFAVVRSQQPTPTTAALGTTPVSNDSTPPSESSTSTRRSTTTTAAGPTVVPVGDTEFGTVTVSGTKLEPLPDTGADPEVGQPAPMVKGEQFDGSSISVAAKGKPAVLVFLAHWCDHCQSNVETIQQYLDDNGAPDDVNIYAITTSTSPSESNYPPSEWLQKENWTVPTLVDDRGNSAAEAFGLKNLTFFVVLDGGGNVVERLAGQLSGSQFARLLDAARR